MAHEVARVWEISARYGKLEPKDTDDSSFAFDTGGGTAHITQSLSTVSRHAPSGKTAPDFQGAIGVTKDRYLAAKKLFGFAPTCHCDARKEWLNHVSDWWNRTIAGR